MWSGKIVKTLALCGLSVVLVFSALTRAEEQLPAEVTAMLTLKVLTFDRNLADRAGAEVVVGLVGPDGDKSYRAGLEKAFKSYTDKKVNGLPIRVVTHDYVDLAQLADWMAKEKVSVLFLSPGMLGQAAEIHGLASRHKCLTAGGSGSFPRQGTALGFEVEDGKPKIVIHRKRSQEEGVDFSANLLQIAKVL